VWSISESKTFQRCQRQWFLKNIVGSAISRDPFRQRIYRLGKLESISSWRGNIVDDTISNFVIPGVLKRAAPSLEASKRYAMKLFDRQLVFARQHRLHDPLISPANAGSEFAAFRCMEYGSSILEAEIDTARDEVVCALANLYSMETIKERMKSAHQLLPQRPLQFRHSESPIRAVPDVIAFYGDAPPLIVDWKVHVFGLQEAWLQLAVYAMALTRCKPHKDFPGDIGKWQPKDIRLMEIQLLKNEVREYTLEPDELDRAEAYMAESITQISLATSGRGFGELCAEDFLVTQYPEACDRCNYTSVCWGNIQ
jgi:hypothetical protein